MNVTGDALAIFSGRPHFERPLHVGRPNIGNRSRLNKRFRDILDTRILTNDGPFAQAFERAIAERLGVAHCVVTANATLALEIAARALDLSGEVIVPGFTFVATAHAFRWLGLTPVFADILPHGHGIDPAAVEALITERTTAIVGVHLWGRPCAVTALERIAEQHKLALLFDAAQAFGATFNGRPVGGNGRAEILSFHATKVINSFEGGAIVTNDRQLAERAARMREFGFAGYDTVTGLGINAKMSEPSAAMGLTSLEHLDEFIEANRKRYHAYRRGLAGIPGLRVFEYDAQEQCNYHYVVIELESNDHGLSRDELQQVLHRENVLARRYFHPGCHRMEPYRHDPGPRALPVTEGAATQVLCLPTGTSVSLSEVRLVCAIVRAAMASAVAVKRRLADT